jgi:ATP-binding cassette subfamily B (MDR/TAP) protein 1
MDIQNAIGEKVATFIHSASSVVAGFAIAYSYGWQLSLVCTAALPAISLSSFSYFFLLQ